MTQRLDARTVRAWGERYSNWGRWGEDDERGALNFITPERVLAACGLPRTGRVISCALPLGGDALTTPRWSGRGIGGGTRARSLDPAEDGVVARGVLLDLPRLRRVSWLEDGDPIRPDELDVCAERMGVTVEPGDVVLVRTGMMTRCLGEGDWARYGGGPAPGLSIHCARWLYERQVAAVATDTFALEVNPAETPDCPLPLHRIALENTGVRFGENFHLDALAEACAEDGNYAFLFVAPPLPIPGTPGTPIHPLAVK